MLLSRQDPCPSDVVSRDIFSLRSEISLAWFLANFNPNQQNVKILYQFLKKLLKLVESQNAMVSQAALNAFGAFLISIAPFHSNYLIKGFQFLNENFKPNTISSLCIVFSFTYLSSFVPPYQMKKYLNKFPIIHHLQNDFSKHQKYVPKLVEQISFMDLIFQQSLMLSLINHIPEQLSIDFIGSIVTLLIRFPNELIPILLNEIIEIEDLLRPIGRGIVTNPSLLKVLNDEQKQAILETAHKALLSPNINGSQIEESISIIISLNDIDFVKNIPISSSLQIYLIPLYDDIEHLSPSEDDSINVLCAKINAFVNLGPQYDEFVLEQIEKIVRKTDSTFIAAVEYLSKSINDLIKRNKQNESISKILTIIFKPEYERNWIHNLAIVDLIEELDQFLIPTITIKEIVHFLVESMLSPYDELVENATKATKCFVSKFNIDIFLSELFLIDMFDFKKNSQMIHILNALRDVIDTNLWGGYVKFIEELMLMNFEEIDFISDCLSFLSHFQSSIKFTNPIIKSCCLKQIQNMFLSFTHIDLKISNSTNTLPPFTSLVTTDIINDDIQKEIQLLKQLEESICFMIKFYPDSSEMAIIIINTIYLFKNLAVHYLHGNFRANIPIKKILKLFETTNSMETLGKCARILSKYNTQIPDKIVTIIHSIINSHDLKLTARSAVGFFSFVFSHDNSKAEQCVHTLLDKFTNDPKELALFFFRINRYLSKRKVSYDFIPTLTYEWLQTNPYSIWPVFTNDDTILKLLPKEEKIKLSDFESFDSYHWLYFFNNIDMFEVKNYEKYKIEHKNLLKKLDLIYEMPTFKLIDIDKNIPKYATLTQMLLKGKYLLSVPLLDSFFKFSYLRISQELFDEIYEKIHLESMKQYAERFKLQCKDLLNAKFKYFERYDSMKFSELLSIQKPKHLLYLFRYLRLEPKRLNKLLFIESVPKFLSISSDFVFYELAMMLFSQYALDEVLQFNEFETFLVHSDESNLLFPSNSMLKIRIALLNSNSPYSIEWNSNYLGIPFYDSDILAYLNVRIDIMMQDLSASIDLLFRPDKPYFKEAAPLLNVLLSMSNDLSKFSDRISAIVTKYFSVFHAIDLISTYYKRQRTFQPNLSSLESFSIDEINLSQKIFKLNPSIQNAHKLSKVHIFDTSGFESLDLFLGLFALQYIPFYSVVILLSKYIIILKQEDFNLFLERIDNSISSFPFKSRPYALKELVKSPRNNQLLYALTVMESNDDMEIQNAFQEYQNL